MPFQMQWTLDASALQSSDAKRLMDALKVEVFGLKHCPFYDFSNCGRRFKIMDPTTDVLVMIQTLVERFNARHEAHVPEDEWLAIPLRNQIKAYFLPTTQRRIDAEVPPVVKRGEWYGFTIQLPSTDACILFLRRWKKVAKSQSMQGHRSKVRGRKLIVSTRHKQLATNLHYAANKLLPHDRGGFSDAVCPLLLWLAFLVAPGE